MYLHFLSLMIWGRGKILRRTSPCISLVFLAFRFHNPSTKGSSFVYYECAKEFPFDRTSWCLMIIICMKTAAHAVVCLFFCTASAQCGVWSLMISLSQIIMPIKRIKDQVPTNEFHPWKSPLSWQIILLQGKFAEAYDKRSSGLTLLEALLLFIKYSFMKNAKHCTALVAFISIVNSQLFSLDKEK